MKNDIISFLSVTVVFARKFLSLSIIRLEENKTLDAFFRLQCRIFLLI